MRDTVMLRGVALRLTVDNQCLIMDSKKIVFQQGRGYTLEKELGSGACGQTVLLHDAAIDEYFVCKKYAPADIRWREVLFSNFVREIKLMHALHHINVVRVFNYVLYPDRFAGYIFMEYINGPDIDAYSADHPEDINSLFAQVVEGFDHLQSKRILHRDIRTTNILVTENGAVKIIDFGFGKQAVDSADFDKSISLNWWCALPPEFAEKIYDHCTEVYFVGKLFEQLIDKHQLSHFQYSDVLRRMVEPSRKKRSESFSHVRQEILGKPRSIEFSSDDVECYRAFTRTLTARISKIYSTATCFGIEDIHLKLQESYKAMMLEQAAQDSALVIQCFIDGGYMYYSKQAFPVDQVRNFLDLLNRCSKEQKNIVEANLHARINALPKKPHVKSGFDEMDDDIPF
ncbi:protein kinase domain-containing protein [Variovorax arabinosiphilus]|uniref:protein kinase domain-containing protein n=1 Tax=Variovorax arabinosiphilus TaxID=3053498 RepID=UPI0025752A8F|nr:MULTISPECIES: protein kinase [unclassified Variovorax]MDM0118853.1 protein kinase [Variovorax sp. J2L1-78]MDM0129278.1 protein kinase [Variovorax sp. J2L1-63]MDM0232935.1 protein kinase [Variovorax sp. J2R1-6]